MKIAILQSPPNPVSCQDSQRALLWLPGLAVQVPGLKNGEGVGDSELLPLLVAHLVGLWAVSQIREAMGTTHYQRRLKPYSKFPMGLLCDPIGRDQPPWTSEAGT